MTEPSLGHRYGIETIIPPVAQHTEYVDAGAVTIGVEYRVVDENTVLAHLRTHGMDRPPPGARQQIDDDGGVSLHVCDAATRTEYLRFDIFGADPHYHYLCHNEYQLNIAYDRNACGDMTAWALECIRHRLPDMLAFCGADDLARQVDPDLVAAAVPRVVELVERSRRVR